MLQRHRRRRLSEARTLQDGATAVEYSLLIVFITAVIVVVVGFLGLDVLALFNSIEDVWNGDQG